jgi:hypothetical protein
VKIMEMLRDTMNTRINTYLPPRHVSFQMCTPGLVREEYCLVEEGIKALEAVRKSKMSGRSSWIANERPIL